MSHCAFDFKLFVANYTSNLPLNVHELHIVLLLFYRVELEIQIVETASVIECLIMV